MRVALDATPLIGIRTGIGTFVDEIVRGLNSSVIDGDLINVIEYTLSVGARRRGDIRGVWVPIPAGQAPTLWRRTKRPLIERFTGKIDLVHGTNYLVPPSKAPRLVTVHDLSFVHDPVAAPAPVARFDRAVADAVQSGATIHALSNYVAEEIAQRYGAEKIVVVSPGVHIKSVPASAKGNAKEFILALGATVHRKRIPTLVRAFERVCEELKEIQLYIVGPPGDDEGAVKAAIKKLPLSVQKRVLRIGRVNDLERDRLLADASLLAHPSEYEGFGLPVIEAMAAKTPVITTTGGSLAEVAADAAVLVEPENIDDLATGILHILSSPETRQTLIEKGQVRAAEYSWESTAKGLINVYRDIAM
ncbi:MAG: glycosyltransferase family 1 protein [Actinomycetota bacterium]|nr:glycosyltransferase family 1 protein [Actinomycetota bacterium]MDG1489085.1 glycosyltransferase family 1 protein [Actinomycetota bacterium]MDG2119697.1 glycosyltransferase family 1 protein [Actinomycetota bacterium]